MGFSQQQRTVERESFNLDNPNDRRVIQEFERELAAYIGRKVNVFGREISGFDLYCHEKALYRYSKRYPTGAVVYENIGEYRFAIMKKKALDDLQYRRQLARNVEAERIEAMAV